MFECDFYSISLKKNFNILLFSDFDDFSISIKNEISKSSHKIEHTNSINILHTSNFDVALIDIDHIKSEDIKKTKELIAKSNAIFITLTNISCTKSSQNSIDIGVFDCISKGLSPKFIVQDLIYVANNIFRNRFYSILIYDEDQVFVDELREKLYSHQLNTLEATNEKDLFLTIKEEKVSLLIFKADSQKSYKILQSIRDKYTSTDLPILIITKNKKDVFSNILKSGVQDFIEFPISEEMLLLKIDTWINYIHESNVRKCEQKILQEYKIAVDESSIVSKTDPTGKITYVNKEFCKISLYTEKELLGKPHNIVRHPDMPKEAFREMWETIKNKKVWKGIVKNRKKDGTSYYVQTVIKPIIGSNGEITEFIGLRVDITQQQEFKEYLEEKLNLTSSNFEDAINLSKIYENAINESNILSRTDVDGIITYANQAFYDTTGYTKSEVIGKTHNIMKHKDNPTSIYEDMWNTIKDGNIWRGTVKNRTKDNQDCYLTTTIFPIMNKIGEISEFMAVRHNVSDIVKLHEELEDTQKEVIYKMGEIGETRSKETGNHVKRVAQYSKLLATKFNLSAKEIEILENASPMHDIGKVGIPDSVLLKPAKLTNEEYEIIKTHAILGESILDKSERPLLKAAAIIAGQHHEKYNGKGYPRGLKGEDIHIYGRITAIADVFDALISHRVYKPSWSRSQVLDLFNKERGEHFDPTLTDIFLNNFNEFMDIAEKHKD